MENKRILAVGKVHEDFISLRLSPAPQPDEDVQEVDTAYIESELQDYMDFMEDKEWQRWGC
jgi:hypothetical protein